jgi:hypothetical protein
MRRPTSELQIDRSERVLLIVREGAERYWLEHCDQK